MSTRLLAAKLHTPSPRPDWLARPHLLRRLEVARDTKLVLLSAPPGYGKTALLSQWISCSGIRAAWLSLDEGDNDLARFLAYVVAALQGVDPAIGQDWSDLFRLSQLPPIEEIATLLLNDLARTEARLALILDDYHLITAQPIHGALTFLLNHLPPQVLVIVSTRADPPLPLARLRARRQLLELRVADLCFAQEEVQALFREAFQVDLGEGEIATLQARTEGWIAGLQMAALSMRAKKDVAGFVASLSGSHRHIADYLADEVLDLQPPHIQDFLLKTAILNRLTGPLCDAVTGRSDSQQILEQLDDDNLFLIPLDDDRCWYRYHSLFADLLRVRLNQAGPGLAQNLHHRACQWFAGTGDLDAAIGHAMAASDSSRALDLLDQHAYALWSRGEHATLLRWLEALGPDLLRAKPRLCLHHALALVMAGEFSTGLAHLQRLESELDMGLSETAGTDAGLPGPADKEHQALVGMVAAGRAYVAYYQRNVPDMLKFGQRALRQLSEENAGWRGGLHVILGNAYEHSGEVEAATQEFSRALALGRTTGNRFLSLTASVHLAVNHRFRGQLRRAVALCQEQLSPSHLSGLPDAGVLHAVWGDVLREWNQMDEARHHIQRSRDLCEKGRAVAMTAWSDLALVRLYFSEQDLAGAEQALQKLDKLAEAPLWVQTDATAWKARVWLAQGKLIRVSRLLEGRGLELAIRPAFLHLQESIALARLYLAQNRERVQPATLAAAVDLLTRLQVVTEEGGWTGLLIQVLVLLALAHHDQGDAEVGLAVLNEALDMAEPEGFVRTFLDEGAPITNMLRRAAARQDLSRYARQLLAVADEVPREPAQALDPVQELPLDPLTDRQLEVLRLMAQGLTNREIAEKLFITTGTVKVHASHIYDKLAVNGRVQAVAWARELNLL